MVKILVRPPLTVRKWYKTDVEQAQEDGNASGLAKFGLLIKLFIFVYGQCTNHRIQHVIYICDQTKHPQQWIQHMKEVDRMQFIDNQLETK